MTDLRTAPARILLVEDEELNRALVRAVLARAGSPILKQAHIVEADNLAHARESLATETVDIVLLDVQLPDGSGLSLVDEIVQRGGGAGGRPSIIALTAGVLGAQREAALAAGCDAFLDKPYTSADLLAILTTYLG